MSATLCDTIQKSFLFPLFYWTRQWWKTGTHKNDYLFPNHPIGIYSISLVRFIEVPLWTYFLERAKAVKQRRRISFNGKPVKYIPDINLNTPSHVETVVLMSRKPWCVCEKPSNNAIFDCFGYYCIVWKWDYYPYVGIVPWGWFWLVQRDLDVSAWRVVSLDVFRIFWGCVVSLDVYEKDTFLDGDRPKPHRFYHIFDERSSDAKSM